MLPPAWHGGWLLWGAAPFIGAKLVLPGVNPTPEVYLNLILEEKINLSAAVPTLFFLILDYIKKMEHKPRLDGLRLIFAGQSPPYELIKSLEEFGARCYQLYGFAEAGPYVAPPVERPYLEKTLSQEERLKYASEVAGVPVCGMEVKLIDPESKKELPWDGKTIGIPVYRAPWLQLYWKESKRLKDSLYEGEWLDVGDLATIDENGCIRIVDRAKDVIKSGGEWISSIKVENLLMSHPGIKEACVIAAEHPKWVERPIAVVVPEPGWEDKLNVEELRKFIESQGLPKWWAVDEIVIVDEIPRTSVGKFDKKVLRDKYRKILIEKENV